MYKLKLIGALSYSGIVKASQDNPIIYTDNIDTANAAVATGYFKMITDGIEGESEIVAAPEEKSGKTIEEMTVSELETFATYNNVSLKGTKGKANIIAKLKKVLGDEATSGIIEYGSPTMVELQEE